MASPQIKHNRAARAEPRAVVARRSWQRRTAALTGVALAVATIAGAATASTTSTTDVTFVPLTAAHTVLSNATIGAHKTSSPVVIGASTTVPTDATTVQLNVIAKGASAGTLAFYPTGNPGGGSGQALSYPSGNVLASARIEENVGQSSELTFANNGSGSVVVTATLIGYSTQATAGDINGTGGTTGQVLTDNGAGGAQWETLPPGSAADFSATGGTVGQALTNTGTGAVWADPGGPLISQIDLSGSHVPVLPDLTTPAFARVNAGNWMTVFTAQLYNSNNFPVTVHCSVLAPSGTSGYENYVTLAPFSYGEVVAQGIVRTNGGVIQGRCGAEASGVTYPAHSVISATQGTSGNGYVIS